jgi:hypothetical protein
MVIGGLANRGEMVIVGRGGQFILENDDRAFHVRIIASEGWRAKTLSAEKRISIGEARDLMKKADEAQRRFIEQSFKRDIDEPGVYHLVIDTSKFGIDASSAVIVHAARLYSTTHKLVAGWTDRRGVERRGSDRRRGDRRSPSSEWSSGDIEHAILREDRVLRQINAPDRRQEDRRRKVKQD